jgi:hypothetical protein
MVYLKKDNHKENHAGSIVKWPTLKYPERKVDYTSNPVEKMHEDILLEPVDGQILVTLNKGFTVLSAGEYPLVQIIDADLFDEECELRLKQLKLRYQKNKVTIS